MGKPFTATNSIKTQYITVTGRESAGKFVSDRMASFETGSRTTLLNEKGEIIREIIKNAIPLKVYKTTETRRVTLKAYHGTSLCAGMILPKGLLMIKEV